MIIASTSTLHNSGYLEYLLPELSIHFKTAKRFFYSVCKTKWYNSRIHSKSSIGFHQNKHTLKGIHEYNDPIEALQNAEGIFTGGNTFYLLHSSTKNNLLSTINQVVKQGTPYWGQVPEVYAV
jgi:dipeptidase E